MTPSTPADPAPDGGAREPVGGPGDPARWCGQCGEALAGGDHARCERRAELEPPRWCAHCRRRMKVQVTPGAWTATCVAHGAIEQPTWS
ncbi:MAG TPA: hypothetical protein VFL46_03880 [Phycicoccus sp.]|nr:hypothetical protein [Phycicoccus sp.]